MRRARTALIELSKAWPPCKGPYPALLPAGSSWQQHSSEAAVLRCMRARTTASVHLLLPACVPDTPLKPAPLFVP